MKLRLARRFGRIPKGQSTSSFPASVVVIENLIRRDEALRVCLYGTRDGRVSDQASAHRRSRLRAQARPQAEILVLRQQVLILDRKNRARARPRNFDRLVLVWLYRVFPSVLNAITMVKPETVIRYHWRGFRAYWHWKSGWSGGRPRIDREVRDLVRRMNRPRRPMYSAERDS